MGNFSTAYTATATGTAAVVTLPAKAAQPVKPWTVTGFLFGYSETPPAGATLTVTDAGATVLSVPVTAAGPGPIIIPPTNSDGNAALVCTLSAGGGSIVASLTVFVA